MRQNIFSKLLTTYLVIAMSIILSLNFLLIWFFHNHYQQRYKRNLLAVIEQVLELTEKYNSGELTEESWEYSLGVTSKTSGINISIYNYNNHLIISTDKEFTERISLNVLNELRSHKNSDQANFTIIKDPRDPSLNIFLVYAPVKEPLGEGIAIAYTTIADMNQPLGQALHLIWLASILVLACAVPALYLLSKHFTQPLREMHRAALSMAKGDFNQQLTLTRQDEIGTLAKALNEMSHQLSEIEKTRQEFLANVSHELRTPLTSIRGFVQGMLDGTIPVLKHHLYLSRVYTESQRLSYIVNDLLDIARIRSGQIDLKREEIDLWDVCREAADCITPLAKEKEIKMALLLPDKHEKAPVYADHCRLMQVFLNITENAVRFTPPGCRVQIKGELADKKAIVSIIDEGPGIPPEDIPFIFERFYRGNFTNQFQEGGTGLGLAISKLLMDVHGGKIDVQSKTGQGSIFRISLSLYPHSGE